MTAPSALSTAATARSTACLGTSSPRTAAERAATTVSTRSFAGATKATPARSLSANAIVSPWTFQYENSAKSAGANSTKPSNRNLRA